MSMEARRSRERYCIFDCDMIPRSGGMYVDVVFGGRRFHADNMKRRQRRDLESKPACAKIRCI
eukprot:IDg21021t1